MLGRFDFPNIRSHMDYALLVIPWVEFIQGIFIIINASLEEGWEFLAFRNKGW